MLCFFIFYATGPTDPFRPTPAPHFKTLNLFLIYVYFPKCPSFIPIQYNLAKSSKREKYLACSTLRRLCTKHRFVHVWYIAVSAGEPVTNVLIAVAIS